MVINNQSRRKKLPIDIISINCKNPEESLKALDYCKSFFTFENSILFTDKNIEKTEHSVIKINKFKNIHDYSNFVLTLNDYINSDHVLVIQDDGHIVNPDVWDDNFLDYDYIGAPWPTEYKFRKRWKKEMYKDSFKNSKINRVGNGGFSLRSKKFLEYSSLFKDCNGIPEDVFLCLVNYQKAIEENIRFAPFDIAYKFSYEVPLMGKNLDKEDKSQIFDSNYHFGWHGKRFLNSDELINLKNQK